MCGWVCTPASRQALAKPEAKHQSGAKYKSNCMEQVLGGVAGCLGGLLVLALCVGCALVVIAAIVWAWHYLFG